MNLDDSFAVVCTGFHEVVVCTRYIPYHSLPLLLVIFLLEESVQMNLFGIVKKKSDMVDNYLL